jgi:uncharacterized protein YkwD
VFDGTVTAESPTTGWLRGVSIGAALAILAATALVQPTPADANRCSHQNATPGSTSADNAERSVLCLLNKQRAKSGVSKLRRHRELDKPSAKHSKLMVRDKCFEHVCPGEDDLDERIAGYLAEAAGGYGYGENIAWGSGELGSPRNIVRSWMKSEGHRRNILDPDFEHIGIGIVWGSPSSTVGGKAGTYTTDFGYRDD